MFSPAFDLAGVPAVAIGNFTWDWIYAGYPEAIAGAPGLVPAIRDAHKPACAGHGWTMRERFSYSELDV